MLYPGSLHTMHNAVLGQPFDGGDFLADGVAQLHAAGAHRRAVDLHGAGAALRDATAVFRASEAKVFARNPKQRGIRFGFDVKAFSVDGKDGHVRLLHAGQAALEARQAKRILFERLSRRKQSGRPGAFQLPLLLPLAGEGRVEPSMSASVEANPRPVSTRLRTH